MNIDQYSPQSGRFLKEDGTYINIADALGGTETGQIADIEKHAAHSGRFIKEDGTVINIAESIGSGGGGSGGSSDDSATPIVEEYNGQVIQSFISADRPLQGLKLFATTEQATTTGAQLWDVEKAKKLESWTGKTGYKYFDIQLKSNTTYCLFVSENNMYKDYNAEYNGHFAFYIGETPNSSNSNTLFGNCNIDKTGVLLNKIFTTTENPFYFNLYLLSWDEENLNIVFDEILKNIMLVEGSSVLPYEPYTGGKPSPSPEYPQEIQTISDFVVEVKNSMGEEATPQTLDVTIPEQGFYGLAVDSDGNYTDSNNQRWYADCFNYKTKKFVKCIEKTTAIGEKADGTVLVSGFGFASRIATVDTSTKYGMCEKLLWSSTWNTQNEAFTFAKTFSSVDSYDIIATLSHGTLGTTEETTTKDASSAFKTYLSSNPLTFFYVSKTPIEYDLTDAQVEEFENLRSYYGTTYIDNDAVPACNMQAELVLDTKMYIDNKFATLAGQILEMGA